MCHEILLHFSIRIYRPISSYFRRISTNSIARNTVRCGKYMEKYIFLASQRDRRRTLVPDDVHTAGQIKDWSSCDIISFSRNPFVLLPTFSLYAPFDYEGYFVDSGSWCRLDSKWVSNSVFVKLTHERPTSSSCSKLSLRALWRRRSQYCDQCWWCRLKWKNDFRGSGYGDGHWWFPNSQ